MPHLQGNVRTSVMVWPTTIKTVCVSRHKVNIPFSLILLLLLLDCNIYLTVTYSFGISFGVCKLYFVYFGYILWITPSHRLESRFRKYCMSNDFESISNDFCSTSSETAYFIPPAHHELYCKNEPGLDEFCYQTAVEGHCDPALLLLHKNCAKACDFCPRFKPGQTALTIPGWFLNTVDFGYKGLSLMGDDFSGPFVQNVRNFRQL